MARISVYCLVLFSIIIGFGFSAPTGRDIASLEEPCAIVASTLANSTDGKPPATVDDDAYPRIPAKLAIACLRSIPFNATYAVEWVESLKPYLQWQSTTAYVKNPPPGYWHEPWDMIGYTDGLINHIKTAGYPNEYEFEIDLYRILRRAYDGHARYFPMLFSGIFSFGRPVPLVSVSSDGKSLPRAYVYDDILHSLNVTSFIPSPITHLYDMPVEEVLQDFSQWGASSDQDAQYNTMFMNLAQASLGYLGIGAGMWAGGGRGTLWYPGDYLNITFENGTDRSYNNFARVLQDFSGITSGRDLRNKFLPTTTTDPWPPVPSPAASNKTGQHNDTSFDKRALSGPAGYPNPIKLMPGNYVSGYYLTGQGYENVAVLALPSFGGPVSQSDFQNIVFNFIDQAKKDGKTRLIVDVSANGGGQIPQAYSVFKNLFPDIDPYGGNRFRAFEDFNIIGEAVTEAVGSAYPWRNLMPPGPGLLLDDFVATPFIATADMDISGKPFKSWDEKYGPHARNGDNFTSIIRWNLSDPALAAYSGFDPNRYGPHSAVLSERPFAVEDVVILSDGYCASTCAIFMEFMTQQAKVKTIAVGGRGSTPIGPMQPVGGVRGVNVYDFYTIGSFVREAASLVKGTPRQAEFQAMYKKYTNMPMDRAADQSGRVNVRDNIRQGDAEEVPIQFRYQEADCRIFYEKEHTVDVSTLWKSAADAAWNGDRCAEGGISKADQPRSDAYSSLPKRHSMRRMRDGEMKQLRDTWRQGNDVNKLKSMRGFQLP